MKKITTDEYIQSVYKVVLYIEKKITQIAQESGYETSASFTKAFKKYFGVTPKEFSKNLKTKKGFVMLEPKIVELKDVAVLYVRKEGEYTKSAGEAWEVLMGFTYKNKVKKVR